MIGHNYLLSVTTEVLSEDQEIELDKLIQKNLIQKIDSRDLGLHVDFLKGVEINDLNLLKAFWSFLEPIILPASLEALSLESDDRTKTSLLKDGT